MMSSSGQGKAGRLPRTILQQFASSQNPQSATIFHASPACQAAKETGKIKTSNMLRFPCSNDW